MPIHPLCLVSLIDGYSNTTRTVMTVNKSKINQYNMNNRFTIKFASLTKHQTISGKYSEYCDDNF